MSTRWLTALFFAVLVWSSAAAEIPIDIHIDTSVVLSRISSDFIGFGYESSAVAQPGFFCATNTAMIRLYDNLSPHGLIRIGGNVSDHTRFDPDGVATPKTERETTVINNAQLRDLGDFARATGWKVMWGLNLGSGSKEEAAQEALAVNAALGPNLHSFEIGNEVDALHRFAGKYDAYHAAFSEYKAAIRAALPHAKFSGPDVIGNWQWITNFVATEAGDMVLLTQHYYRGGASQPASTLERLLQHDHGFDTRLGRLRELCQPHGLGFRINEVNSYSGGGKAGVSDTFGSALWCLDYMFRLASFGCNGVNIETDVNQLGFISHYSPIVHDPEFHCSARPEYYGMLAFAMAGRGDMVHLAFSSTNINLTAYATKDASGALWLTAIDKDFARSARIQLDLPSGYHKAEIFRLTAPSMRTLDRVTFAGSKVSEDGSWSPRPPETNSVSDGVLLLKVSSASAAVVKISP
jgi:hypothetical protein